MKREVWYLSHPVGGDVAGNVRRAKAWLRWLMASEPDLAFEASWLAALAAGADDSDPHQRARGLADCVAIASRCDGIVLVGGQVTRGMADELDAVYRSSGSIADLTSLGALPPAEPIAGAVMRARSHLRDANAPVIDIFDWLQRDIARQPRRGGF